MPFGVIKLHARPRERREYPTVGGRAPGCITWLGVQARVPYVILGRGPRESGGVTTSLHYRPAHWAPVQTCEQCLTMSGTESMIH